MKSRIVFLITVLMIISFVSLGQFHTINVGSSPNDGTGSSLRSGGLIVNSNFSLAQYGSAVLSNLVGTASMNVTNATSLSTSNATSKPLYNSYSSGILELFGLEAGANITLTPNASNIVVAASSSGGSIGSLGFNSNQFGTNTTVSISDGAYLTNLVGWVTSRFEYVVITNNLNMPGVSTASAVALFDSGKNLVSSGTISQTELNYLDGVTSGIQGQIDARQGGSTTLTNLVGTGAITNLNTSQFAGSAIHSIKSGAVLTNAINYESVTIPQGTSPTTDAVGEIAIDSDALDTARGTIQFFDGTNNVYVVAITNTPTDSQVPVFNGTTKTWSAQDQSGSASTNLNAIGVNYLTASNIFTMPAGSYMLQPQANGTEGTLAYTDGAVQLYDLAVNTNITLNLSSDGTPTYWVVRQGGGPYTFSINGTSYPVPSTDNAEVVFSAFLSADGSTNVTAPVFDLPSLGVSVGENVAATNAPTILNATLTTPTATSPKITTADLRGVQNTGGLIVTNQIQFLSDTNYYGTNAQNTLSFATASRKSWVSELGVNITNTFTGLASGKSMSMALWGSQLGTNHTVVFAPPTGSRIIWLGSTNSLIVGNTVTVPSNRVVWATFTVELGTNIFGAASTNQVSLSKL